jgi:GNAT superfamily N-acetyltransferase
VTPELAADYPRTVVSKDGAHVVLRPMTGADAAAVAALRARVPAEEGSGLGADADAIVVLAWEGDRAAGAVILERRDEAAVVRIVLDPAYRERRIGTWMLLDAVHLAGALGCTRLETTARPPDRSYRSALARLDFIEQPTGAFVKPLHTGWPDF